MTGRIEPYGRTHDGVAVERITLEGELEVEVLTYGGIIARLEAPDRTGRRADVVLGLGNLDDYLTRNPNFGAAVGRYAGRIGGARFVLDGVEHHLAKNNGDNALHGGPTGFAKRVWTVESASPASVALSYVSADGEEGYPGTLRTTMTYTVEGATLRIAYEAATDRATVLNLTNHSYFNVGGEGSGDVFGHELEIAADRVLETDEASIPTGRMLDVDGTPFDFRTRRRIGERVRDAHQQILFGLGYDQCYALRGAGLREVASLRDGTSGRVMRVRTDQPGLQLYTANKLTGALHGPSGRTYRSGDAVCLETQHFPDSPNRPDFPSTVLRPGVRFVSVTEYSFSAE